MRHWIILILMLFEWTVGNALDDVIDPAALAYRSAYVLVLDGKWSQAKDKFEELVKRFPESHWAEGSQYWLCYIQEKLGAPLEKVYTSYMEFIEKHPNSEWVRQASANLVRLSWYLHSPDFDIQNVPFVYQQISKDEDSQLSALFALQAVDSNAALRITEEIYDSSRSETLRGKLIYVLGSFRTLGAAEKLGKIMRSDSSMSIRSDAISLLANTRRPEAYELLRGMVTSDEPANLRAHGLEVLAKAKVRALDTLCFHLALHEQNQDLASEAAAFLSDLGEKADTRMFQRLLLEEKHPRIRRIAFFTLVGSHRQALSRETLRKMARKDKDPMIRLCAARLVGMSGERLEAALVIVDMMNFGWGSEAGERILEALARYPEKIRMISWLYWEACNSPAQGVASIALEGLGKLLGVSGGTTYADVATKSIYRPVRIAALMQIVATKATVEVDVLGGILQKDPDIGVRIAAIQALSIQRNDAAVAVLLEAANIEKEQSIRRAVATALEEIDTPSAHEALKTLKKR